MKCPKCGFTSFDFLENCKKCGQDLQEHKQKFGLRSLIFPNLRPEPKATPTTGADNIHAEAATNGSETDFGFDFMSDDTPAEVATTATAASAVTDDPTDQPATAETTAETAAEAPSAPTEEAAEEPLGDFSFDAASDDQQPVDEEDAGFELAEDFDFSSDEAEVEPNGAAMEENGGEFAFAAAEDSIDLASDEDLDFEEESEELNFSEPAEEVDLSEWEEPEEPASPPAEETSEEAREPSDPFDLRGSVEAGRAPATYPAEDHDEPADQDRDGEPPSSEAADETETAPPPELAKIFGFAEEPDSNPESAAPEPVEQDADAGLETETAPSVDADQAILLPSLGARLSASACDLLILALVFVLFLAAGQQILNPHSPAGLLPDRQTLLELSTPYFLVLFALCFGYFTLFHFLTGQTPGKMLFKLRVEDLTGQPLNFSQAFLRSVGGLCSLLPAGLGFLVVLFSPGRRGWNDRLAGSRLVPVFHTDPDDELSQN